MLALLARHRQRVPLRRRPKTCAKRRSCWRAGIRTKRTAAACGCTLPVLIPIICGASWNLTWRGWILSAIALTLATCLIAGVDLRYYLIHWIGFNLGWRANFWFVSQFMIGHIFEIRLTLLAGWAGWQQFMRSPR